MKAELTAFIEKAPGGGYWAVCPEFPGANGQGETLEEAKKNLKEAIELIVQDRLEDYCREFPSSPRPHGNETHHDRRWNQESARFGDNPGSSSHGENLVTQGIDRRKRLSSRQSR